MASQFRRTRTLVPARWAWRAWRASHLTDLSRPLRRRRHFPIPGNSSIRCDCEDGILQQQCGDRATAVNGGALPGPVSQDVRGDIAVVRRTCFVSASTSVTRSGMSDLTVQLPVEFSSGIGPFRSLHSSVVSSVQQFSVICPFCSAVSRSSRLLSVMC